MFAPIVLFVFNRPRHTRRTIDSLRANELASRSDLFVFSEGARSETDDADVKEVRALVGKIDGFKTVTVHEQSMNCGLAGSVIDGVSKVIQRFGKVIVVEDDLELSPSFLNYMNGALERYEQDPRIFSIGGYSPPVDIPESYTEASYLSFRCCTWGWATWRDRWEKVDWAVTDFEAFCQDRRMIERFNRGGNDMFHILRRQMAGEISSWGIRWDYAHFTNDAYCFRPTRSLVLNTGHDGTGTHCGLTKKFDVLIDARPSLAFPEPAHIKLDEEINRRCALFFDGRQGTAATSGALIKKATSVFRKMVSGFRKRYPG